MALKDEFKEHAEKAKSLPASTKDADKLVLYGLYKQATVDPGSSAPQRGQNGMLGKQLKGRAREKQWLITSPRAAAGCALYMN